MTQTKSTPTVHHQFGETVTAIVYLKNCLKELEEKQTRQRLREELTDRAIALSKKLAERIDTANANGGGRRIKRSASDAALDEDNAEMVAS